MFLTNKSANRCALTLSIMMRKKLLARLPRISANSNENYRPYNFQALANISGNIKFSANLQPWPHLQCVLDINVQALIFFRDCRQVQRLELPGVRSNICGAIVRAGPISASL